MADEQRQHWIDDFNEREGTKFNLLKFLKKVNILLYFISIQLDSDDIQYNSGLRFIAKLMLNSLWGKDRINHRQRSSVTIPRCGTLSITLV